ncbi:MAG: Hsp20/alpha crystallin family protein [Bacteroidota bacterium]
MFVRFDVPDTINSILEDFAFNNVKPTYMPVYPAINITGDEKQTVVTAEVPGVKKEDVKIVFEKNVLTISGERKPYELPENSRVWLNEMRVRNFERSIEFDHDVDADKISAEIKDGLLRIVLPKTEASQPRPIQVK